MNMITKLASAALFAATVTSASAFEVTNSVEFLNQVSTNNGSAIQAGTFTLRLGYFTSFSNAQVTANAANLSALNANFSTFFTFNAAEQAAGDNGLLDEVEGDASTAGFPYAYYNASSNSAYTTNFASFIGKNMYAFITLDSDPSQYLIVTSSTVFNAGTDFLNAATAFQVSELDPSVQVLVGTNRMADAQNDLQMVPEPSTYAMIGLSAIAIFFLRHRRIKA